MTTLPIPRIETARLVLRAPVASDFPAFAAFRASDRARSVGGPYGEREAFQQLCAIAGHWQMRGYGRWMVADRATDAPLGVVGPFMPVGWPEPEIGWSVFDGAEGRGVAFEAALAARAWVYRTLRWTTVVSMIAPDNARSIALARRLGAAPDGDFADPDFGRFQIWRHPAPEACAA